MPMATAIPPRDIKFADMFNHDMTMRAKPIEIGIESNTKKVVYYIVKSAIQDVYFINNQNGIVYKKDGVWIIENIIDKKKTSNVLDIRF